MKKTPIKIKMMLRAKLTTTPMMMGVAELELSWKYSSETIKTELHVILKDSGSFKPKSSISYIIN